jgi:hypothetical protein
LPDILGTAALLACARIVLAAFLLCNCPCLVSDIDDFNLTLRAAPCSDVFDKTARLEAFADQKNFVASAELKSIR